MTMKIKVRLPLLDSNDFGLMVYFVGWETIEIWFSGVREYRTGENDKLNYLCPEMKWPIMRAAGTGGGLPQNQLGG